MTASASAPGDRLSGFDFDRHNAEIADLWAAFRAQRPTARIPIILGTNTRYFLLNRAANTGGTDFRRYSDDADVMFDTLLTFQRWNRFNLLQDAELGLPREWILAPDFQNYYEAAWFGCEIRYHADQVPDTLPDFAAAPERLLDGGIPDPFAGFGAKVLAIYQHFCARAARETYLDRPITVEVPTLGTDGPMTVACNLFGAGFVCETMAADPDRLHTLLAFITEATIRRITAWRQRAGLPVPQPGFGFADDSLALISVPMYREHILPHHQRLCQALATDAPRSIHLCGDATRHFVTIRDALNVQCFDTGFPVDFGRLRHALGPGVQIQGGPHVDLLMRSSPAHIHAEVRRILTSGVLEGGRFVLREGNNLAPGTPLANTEALYKAGREFGRLR